MATPIKDLATKFINTNFMTTEFDTLMETRRALNEDNQTALFFAILAIAKKLKKQKLK